MITAGTERNGTAGITLEPLRWWDIERLTELERILFPTDSPWTAAMFWAELAAGHHYVVHRDEAGDVIGDAGLAIGQDKADVQTIGVHPSAQGRGIGRALLRDLLLAVHARPVLLDVRTDNAAAIGLYESEGFVRIGVRRGYYRPSGADAFTMHRPGMRRSEMHPPEMHPPEMHPPATQLPTAHSAATCPPGGNP